MANKNYSTIEANKRIHVLCDVKDRYNYAEANYRGTGKGLCGIVPKGGTIEEWTKKFGK